MRISTNSLGILGSVASLIAATLYQGERHILHAAGMLLRITGKFAMGKLKSSPL
jgi:cytochrome c biogenesis protein CcdA